MQIYNNSSSTPSTVGSPQDNIALAVTQKIFPQINVSEEEKLLSLRELLLIRLANTPVAIKEKNSSLEALHAIADILLNPQDSTRAQALFSKVENQKEGELLKTLLRFSKLFDYSIDSLMTTSNYDALQLSTSSEKKFVTFLKPVILTLKNTLQDFSKICLSNANIFESNLKNSKKESVELAKQNLSQVKQKGKHVIYSFTPAKLPDEDKALSLIRKLRACSKKTEQRANLIQNYAQSLSTSCNFQTEIRILLSIDNCRALFNELSDILSFFFTSTSLLTNILKMSSSLNLNLFENAPLPFNITEAQTGLASQVLKETETAFNEYKETLADFSEIFIAYTLDKATSLRLRETKLSPNALWIELVDEPTLGEKTTEVASKAHSSSKKSKKRKPSPSNKADSTSNSTVKKSHSTSDELLSSEEPVNTAALSPEAIIGKNSSLSTSTHSSSSVDFSCSLEDQKLLPIHSNDVLSEIKQFLNLVESSPFLHEAMKNSDPLYAQLMTNFRFHLSQLFLAIDWIVPLLKAPELKSYALSQFYFSLSSLIETAICLRYHANYHQLPPIHGFENSLDSLSVLPLLNSDEKNFLQSMSRATLWQRYPFFMKENYPERLPHGLQLTLIASGDELTMPFPTMNNLKQDCHLTFSILRKILQEAKCISPIQFSSEIFDKIQTTSDVSLLLSPASSIDEKCHEIREKMALKTTYSIHRREILGHLHRLTLIMRISESSESNPKYSSMIHHGLAVLPLAIESTLRLITLEKTGVLIHSHDFNECFKLLGNDYSKFIQEAISYKLGRAYYMPACYPSIPFAKKMIENATESVVYLGIEPGFTPAQKKKKSMFSDWRTWAEKGVDLIDRLLSTQRSNDSTSDW